MVFEVHGDAGLVASCRDRETTLLLAREWRREPLNTMRARTRRLRRAAIRLQVLRARRLRASVEPTSFGDITRTTWGALNLALPGRPSDPIQSTTSGTAMATDLFRDDIASPSRPHPGDAPLADVSGSSSTRRIVVRWCVLCGARLRAAQRVIAVRGTVVHALRAHRITPGAAALMYQHCSRCQSYLRH